MTTTTRPQQSRNNGAAARNISRKPATLVPTQRLQHEDVSALLFNSAGVWLMCWVH